MKTRLINIWDHMVGSYWFVPSAIIFLSLIAAFLFPWLDQRYADQLDVASPWMTMSPDSARTILSTISGVMTTVISLVFSLTMLTLSIATSQFGPRLLRSFLNNRSTQVVLGTFVATAIYALIVLSMIRGTDSMTVVPRFSVYAAIVAAVVNLLYLIHFINDISELIQVPNVVLRVARDLDASIRRLYPVEKEEQSGGAPDRCDALPEKSAVLCSRQEGYLQGVDLEAIAEEARKVDVVIRLCVHPGQFVAEGSGLADVCGPCDDADSLEDTINQWTVTGTRRTPRQDVECALLELVELAVRALSAGINDPFTAINCIDRLGASLGRIAACAIPQSEFCDEEGVVRVVMPVVTFSDLLESAFNQIRQHGSGNTAVLIRVVEALGEVARHCSRPSDAEAVLRHVAMLEREGEESIHEPNDREDLRRRADRIRELLRPLVEEAGEKAEK